MCCFGFCVGLCGVGVGVDVYVGNNVDFGVRVDVDIEDGVAVVGVVCVCRGFGGCVNFCGLGGLGSIEVLVVLFVFVSC